MTTMAVVTTIKAATTPRQRTRCSNSNNAHIEESPLHNITNNSFASPNGGGYFSPNQHHVLASPEKLAPKHQQQHQPLGLKRKRKRRRSTLTASSSPSSSCLHRASILLMGASGMCLFMGGCLMMSRVSLPDSGTTPMGGANPSFWRRTQSQSQAVTPPHVVVVAGNDTAPSELLTKGDNNKNSNPFHFQKQSWNAPECTPLTNHKDISYTLVTQSSESRLWMMQHHCKQWGPNHPISIAIGANPLTNDKTASEQNNKPQRFLDQLTHLGCNPQQLSIVVLPLTNETAMDYPVNVLRNHALSQVRTSHVVYLDIDFWPSSDLHSILDQITVRQHLIEHGDKTALVVPAFQIPRQCREYKDCRKANVKAMPLTRKDLIHRIKKHKASQFDPTNRGGHGSTLYDKWLSQSPASLVEIPCFLSDRYEPYLVVRWCRDVPPFQTAFSGYGKNKMVFVMQLRRSGWRFWQIGTAFVTHYPHLDSPTRMLWNGGKKGKQLHRPQDDDAFDFMSYQRGQNDFKFLEFKQWLYQTVDNEAVVPKCPDDINGVGDDDYKLWVPRKSIQHYNAEFIRLGEKEAPVAEEESDSESDDDDDGEEEESEEESEEEKEDSRDKENHAKEKAEREQ